MLWVVITLMKNKGGENEWWVRRRESIRKENVSSHGIYMHRLYQRLKVNLGNFLVFRVLLNITNDIFYMYLISNSSANVNHSYQFVDNTSTVITFIVIWFW